MNMFDSSEDMNDHDDRADNDGVRSGDYRVARIGAALGMAFVLGIRLLLDAIVPGVQPMDPITVTLLGAMVMGLLGVEVRDWWRTGR